MTVYEQKISEMIAKIRNENVRSMMKTSQEHRKYPLDCINDGGLEILVKYILELEDGR